VRYRDTGKHLHKQSGSREKEKKVKTCDELMDKYKKRILDPLKMGPTCCPLASVRNYHYSLRNKPEERSSHLKICRLL
jgi:hypothetical protein